MQVHSARPSLVRTRDTLSVALSRSEQATPPAAAGGATRPWTSSSPSMWRVLRDELCELRWAVLTMICFLTFGSSYIYDFPGAIGTGRSDTIEAAFRQAGRPYTQSMNQLLYSVYSWPNTVLAMFGGLLIDKYFGLRRASLLFALLVCLGSALFYVGMCTLRYPLLLTGRVVFGLGSESLGVAQSSYIARWFAGSRGMSLAFCVTICFARIGSSFNFITSPAVAKRHGVANAVLLGVVACTLSLLACVVLIAVDAYAERVHYLKGHHHHRRRDSGSGGDRQRNSNNNNNNEDYDDDDDDEAASVTATSRSSVMHLSDVANMSVSFWLLCAICTLSYSSLAPFFGIGRNYIEVKYGYSGHRASEYLSSYQLTSAVLSPAIGLLVDAAGRNTWWLLLANASFVAIYVLFVLTSTPALLLLMLLGCVISFLSSALWPAVPWVVQANMVGFSYGVMTSIQNIGLAIVPIVVGVILDYHTPAPSHNCDSSNSYSYNSSSSSSSHRCSSSSDDDAADRLPSMRGYTLALTLFTSIAAASLVASVALLVCDVRYARGVLSSSPTRRRRLLEEQVVLIDDVATPTPAPRGLLRVPPAASTADDAYSATSAHHSPVDR